MRTRGGCPNKPRSRKNTRADKAIQTEKIKAKQETKPRVWLNGEQLKNVFRFKYLGYNFQADGDHRYNLEVRMAIAGERFGKMRHLWKSEVISLQSKLKLFGAAVISVLEYGCEVWTLNEKLQSTLTGWCARKVSLFTGKSIRDECVHPSFRLVDRIRARRLRWLGHILRAGEGYMVRKAVVGWAQEVGEYPAGSIMMDAPIHNSIQDLVLMARDKEKWQIEVKAIVWEPRAQNKKKNNNVNFDKKTNETYAQDLNRSLQFKG